jgi:ankyrin repeat protein
MNYVVAKLLEYGANPNLVDVHGHSCLYIAITKNHEHIIELLITHEGELSLSDYQSANTLCQIVSEGNLTALKLLVEAGADLSLKDRWGNNVRSEAVLSKSGRMLEYLDSFGVH